jgi:hypothetical protein
MKGYYPIKVLDIAPLIMVTFLLCLPSSPLVGGLLVRMALSKWNERLGTPSSRICAMVMRIS